MDVYHTAPQSASANFHRPHMSTSVQDQRTLNLNDPRSCWLFPGDLSTDATRPLDYLDLSPTSTFNDTTPFMKSQGLHMWPAGPQDQFTSDFSAQATTSVDVQVSLDGSLSLTDTSIIFYLPSTHERLEGSPRSSQAISNFTATEQSHGTSSDYHIAADCPTGTELPDAYELPSAAICHVNNVPALAASNFNRTWMETPLQIQMELQHNNPQPQDHMNPHGPHDAALVIQDGVSDNFSSSAVESPELLASSVNSSHRVSFPMSRTSNSSYNSYCLSTDSGEQRRLVSLASPVTFPTSRRSSIAQTETLAGEADIAVPHEAVAIHPGHETPRACVHPKDSSNPAMPWTVASGLTEMSQRRPSGDLLTFESTLARYQTLDGEEKLGLDTRSGEPGSRRWSNMSRSGTARNHSLYRLDGPSPDGLYHCPYEGDGICNHKPVRRKCKYDKHVDSHLKPYRCYDLSCNSQRFSSKACVLRHEREAHGMHGHGDKPFPCPYEKCERSGAMGFPRRWNLLDHMKRVHHDDGEGTMTAEASFADVSTSSPTAAEVHRRR